MTISTPSRTAGSFARTGSDQATRLRALVASLRDRPGEDPAPIAVRPRPAVPARRPAIPVIAVGSGKGGVGKTCLSVNLAIALARTGLRVTLIDADLGSANADVLLGLTPARRLDRAIRGTSCLADLAIDAPGGVRLVPGVVGLAGRGSAWGIEHVLDLMGPLDRVCDAIVLDTSAGIGSSVRSVLRYADLAIIVATPEPTSVADAYALIKILASERAAPMLPAHQFAVGLVINQAQGNLAQRVADRIGRVCERFLDWQPIRLGSIPHDRCVFESVLRRMPVVVSQPDAPASRAIAALARDIRGRFGLSEIVAGLT